MTSAKISDPHRPAARIGATHEYDADNTKFRKTMASRCQRIGKISCRYAFEITGNVIMNKKIGLTFITKDAHGKPRWRAFANRISG